MSTDELKEINEMLDALSKSIDDSSQNTQGDETMSADSKSDEDDSSSEDNTEATSSDDSKADNVKDGDSADEPTDGTSANADSTENTVVDSKSSDDLVNKLQFGDDISKVLEDFKPSEQKFIGDDVDIESIVNDPLEFNKLLNGIYIKAVNDAIDGIKKFAPAIVNKVSSTIEVKDTLKKLVDKFYSENQDIAKFPKVVGAVFEEVYEKSSDKNILNVLKATGDEVRSRLGLEKPTGNSSNGDNASSSSAGKNSSKRNAPPLPKKTGSRNMMDSKQNKNPVLDDIDAMNKSLFGR